MIAHKIAPDKLIIDNPALVVITFERVFKLVELHVINIIYSIYGEVQLIGTMNSDIKKILLHTILEQIYQRILSETDPNTILYINKKFTSEPCEIWNYIDREQLSDFIIKQSRIISRKSPIPIYVDDTTYDITQTESGEIRDTISLIKRELDKFHSKKLTNSDIKEYGDQKGLTSFIRKYHSDDIKKGILFHKYFKGTRHE